jgi:hypothetical protein
VTVAWWLHTPPAQLVLLDLVVVPPLGPTNWRLELQLPPLQLPLPLELQVRPYGPTPLLERTQPASARAEVAMSAMVASASVPGRFRFMMRSPSGVDAISGAGEEIGLAPLLRFFTKRPYV